MKFLSAIVVALVVLGAFLFAGTGQADACHYQAAFVAYQQAAYVAPVATYQQPAYVAPIVVQPYVQAFAQNYGYGYHHQAQAVVIKQRFVRPVVVEKIVVREKFVVPRRGRR